jgi:c-di-GMP-binding flagellar brake protein YcgR
MAVGVKERRRDTRVAATYPAAVHTVGGRLLFEGRTANISENGVFLVANGKAPPIGHEAVITLTLPGASAADVRGGRGVRKDTRTVRYRCRIVRTQPIGHLVGLGVEFLEKIE